MNKVSYALGLSIGQNFRASGFDEINLEDFLAGVRDVLEGAEPQMTYDEAKVVINDYFQEVRRKAVEQNKEAGEEFLKICLLYTSPSPRDLSTSRMPSSA